MAETTMKNRAVLANYCLPLQNALDLDPLLERIGDARATDMAADGEINVGQLVREQHKPEEVVLVVFGSYEGTVIEGRRWDSTMQEMPVPPAIDKSVEKILHEASPENKLLIFDQQPALKEYFRGWMGHRAIGVVYYPERARGNYSNQVIGEL